MRILGTTMHDCLAENYAPSLKSLFDYDIKNSITGELLVASDSCCGGKKRSSVAQSLVCFAHVPKEPRTHV